MTGGGRGRRRRAPAGRRRRGEPGARPSPRPPSGPGASWPCGSRWPARPAAGSGARPGTSADRVPRLPGDRRDPAHPPVPARPGGDGGGLRAVPGAGPDHPRPVPGLPGRGPPDGGPQLRGRGAGRGGGRLDPAAGRAGAGRAARRAQRLAVRPPGGRPPTSRFERAGDDLHATLHVGVAQAALGTQLEVETLEEPRKVAVAAGTQSGHVVRLKGLGVPHLRGRGRGDLFVHVRGGHPDRPHAQAGGAAARSWRPSGARRSTRPAGRDGVLLPHPLGLRLSVAPGGRPAASAERAGGGRPGLRGRPAGAPVDDEDAPPPGAGPAAAAGRGGGGRRRARRLVPVPVTGGGRRPRRAARARRAGVRARRRPAAALTVAFAPAKGDRPEWVVQKLTELGRRPDRAARRPTARWCAGSGAAAEPGPRAAAAGGPGGGGPVPPVVAARGGRRSRRWPAWSPRSGSRRGPAGPAGRRRRRRRATARGGGRPRGRVGARRAGAGRAAGRARADACCGPRRRRWPPAVLLVALRAGTVAAGPAAVSPGPRQAKWETLGDGRAASEWLSTKEAAARLGVTLRSLYRFIDEGELHGLQVRPGDPPEEATTSTGSSSPAASRPATSSTSTRRGGPTPRRPRRRTSRERTACSARIVAGDVPADIVHRDRAHGGLPRHQPAGPGPRAGGAPPPHRERRHRRARATPTTWRPCSPRPGRWPRPRASPTPSGLPAGLQRGPDALNSVPHLHLHVHRRPRR